MDYFTTAMLTWKAFGGDGRSANRVPTSGERVLTGAVQVAS